MSVSTPLTAQRVSDLVLENRVIRAPYYHKEHDEELQFTDPDRGLQWGADVVPAMLGLFRVEHATREDHPEGWVGFARHWRGATLRIDFDLLTDVDESDPIIVVTAIAGRAGDASIDDDEFGAIEVLAKVPGEDDWAEREKQYQAVRRTDDTDGSPAVSAYIAALPGWKRAVATQFDDLVREELPEVRSAVKYHQPFYGIEGQGWFASFSAFSKHVKLSFISESYLDPEPPSGTGPQRQALDLQESDTLDENQVAAWIRQAAENPGMGW
ncbi:DUF1801 domain-containing protein [Halomarina rubra]|uniref:DUF1801 domain-containing protein n=1 Tax=Halomarina rubra TaxID=2071873 RepID=A0ABD6ASN1_9EURY|nr:DUF1801 domain-containing protein [Halomarina rubra]